MQRGPLIACPHCATLHRRVDPGRGGRALCSRCRSELYRRGLLSPEQWLALAFATLIVFAWAQAFPIASLSMYGLDVRVTFWQALRLAWDRGDYGVSVMAGLAGFWLPLMRIALTLWILRAILSGGGQAGLMAALHWLRWLGPWTMIPVLVLAILVAFVKLASLVHVQWEPGLTGFFVLIFLLTGLGRWDAAALWRLAEDRGCVALSGSLGGEQACDACGFVQPAGGERCLRCDARLVESRGRPGEVWALVVAAAIFYVPANVLPVMQVRTLFGTSEHTILGGVIELWRLGSWDLALVVFVASVLVPLTKLMALGFLLLHERPAGLRERRLQVHLYSVVERIGQWSMLDVFAVLLMAAMANFPGLSRILIGPAALSFGLVVVLTIAATLRYDTRRQWRAAVEPGHA